MKKLLPLFALFVSALACAGSHPVTVEPKEIHDTLLNPGRGFATTHMFNDGLGDRLHPKCTVVQFRWYWDELEPAEGQIRFSLIDSVLERCRANGQKLNFRVMCQNGEPRVPLWVRKAGAKGLPYRNDPKNWQPFYADPVFLEKHASLIRALGERYDGHPDVDFVDIGTVGRWGEWHTSGTGMEMPLPEVRKKIIDIYFDSFRKTPLVMLIGGETGLAYAIEKGAGWRADCLGDMGGFNDHWNHMKDFYPQALDSAKANDAWKHAPVVFETCWTIAFWHDKGWDLDYILSEALRWHVSVLNNGSESVPEDWWPRVVEFEKKMGYRLALRKLTHPSRVKAREGLPVEMLWENLGVAPPYRNYTLAVQLLNRKNHESLIALAVTDVRSWLPGEIPLQVTFNFSGGKLAGEYDLGLALLDPDTGKPAIQMANEGRGEDGWYWLSKVTID